MSHSVAKTTQMHDIPLSVEEPGDALPNAEKIASKSNSLRRFFKMPHKKSGEGQMSTEMQEKSKHDNDLEMGETDKDQEPPRRFHLRLGNMQKYDSSMLSCDTSTSASCSKSTLKNSISSYWNMVFKRHHGNASTSSRKSGSVDDDVAAAANPDNIDNNDDDAEVEAIETEIREEVHTLPMSEESVDSASKS